MFLKPRIGDRVQCTDNVMDYKNPKFLLIHKGTKGTVVSVKGPEGIDVKWDNGFYIPINKKHIKKI